MTEKCLAYFLGDVPGEGFLERCIEAIKRAHDLFESSTTKEKYRVDEKADKQDSGLDVG
jgi:hypothetical protein